MHQYQWRPTQCVRFRYRICMQARPTAHPPLEPSQFVYYHVYLTDSRITRLLDRVQRTVL